MAVRVAAAALAALGVLSAACSGASSDTQDIVSNVPLSDGERFVYELVDADGVIVGRGTFTTRARGDTFELVQSYEELDTPPGERPIVDVSSVVVDAATLKPLSSERSIQRRDPEDDESYRATYERGGEDGPRLVATQLRDGEERTREFDLREHYYETQSSLWIWRAIALGEDFEARYVSVNPRDGSQAEAQLVMVDRQTLEVPAGTFDTWRLQVRNGRDTRIAWIHVQAPHEIVQWDNGTLFLRLVEASTTR